MSARSARYTCPRSSTAVITARPWTVMCAYNRINGTYASEHRQLLTDVLRTEWGFDGVVVSDWAAVHDRPRALAAGTRPRDAWPASAPGPIGRSTPSTPASSTSRSLTMRLGCCP